MIETTFIYDLLDMSRGTLTVQYKLFEPVTESGLCPAAMAKKQIETRVRQMICDRAEQMCKQRSENYRYSGIMSGVTCQALQRYPVVIATARTFTDILQFVDYIETNIYPILEDLHPAPTSRFFSGYSFRLKKIREAVQFIKANPGFSDITQAKKRRDLPV